jgi:hypothetical protein
MSACDPSRHSTPDMRHPGLNANLARSMFQLYDTPGFHLNVRTRSPNQEVVRAN